MTFRRIALIIGILIIVFLGVQAVRPFTARTNTSVELVVPDGYDGWLVVAWDCPGGRPLDDFETGDDEYEIAYGADGTVCIADAHPDPGYLLDGYTYASGGEAPAVTGGTLSPAESEGGTPVPDRLGLVLTTGRTYNFAALGIGDAQTLGDSCDLNRFLANRFGEPVSAQPCQAIPTPDDDEE